MKKLLLSVAVFFQSLLILAQDAPKGLNVNDKAPFFTAKDQNEKAVSLEGQLKKGPVVLMFYRGQWCPYCNKQLMQLEDSLQLITAKGATLIAVTAEKPENISKTIEKTKAVFPILFDDSLSIMKSYDVAFAVDAKTIKTYKKYGIDFNEANGKNGANLPVPALYIISSEGKITYKYFNPDYTKRPSVAEIVEHL